MKFVPRHQANYTCVATNTFRAKRRQFRIEGKIALFMHKFHFAFTTAFNRRNERTCERVWHVVYSMFIPVPLHSMLKHKSHCFARNLLTTIHLFCRLINICYFLSDCVKIWYHANLPYVHISNCENCEVHLYWFHEVCKEYNLCGGSLE